MPIIRLSKIINEMQPGDQLEVRADDPAFESDITTWCEKMGHELAGMTVKGKDQVALVVKK